MNLVKTPDLRPTTEGGKNITRREFFPQIVAAALSTGTLLNPSELIGSRLSPTASPLNSSSRSGQRPLGKTGISVSEIGFGSHLNSENRSDPEGRVNQIRKGLELGINLFDIYNHGSDAAFELMSMALGPFRHNVIISLVSVWAPDETMAEVDFALDTFNTDYIDLYRIYSESGNSIDRKYEELQKAKEQGKIRAVGFVSHDHSVLVNTLTNYPELDYLMLPYNFQHQRFKPLETVVESVSWGTIKAIKESSEDPLHNVISFDTNSPSAHLKKMAAGDCLFGACSDSELQPLVRETGVGLIGIKPFAGGGLTTLNPSHPVLQELTDGGTSLPHAALKFVLEASEFSSAIPAMNAIDQIVENCAVIDGGEFSSTDAMLLQLYADAANESKGKYLPEKYRWLEDNWKA